MAEPKNELHSPAIIDDYVRRNYEGLENAKDISIGFLGGRYRVAVTDSQRIVHTLKIDPKAIDADLQAQLKSKARAVAKTGDDSRLGRARKTAAAFKAKLGRGTDREHER